VKAGLALSAPTQFEIFALAIAFPPSEGFHGACTTIRDLNVHGIFAGHLGLTPSKQAAVRLIIRTRMQESESHGHGNEAIRRAQALDAKRQHQVA
jgi:hypothetical protein